MIKDAKEFLNKDLYEERSEKINFQKDMPTLKQVLTREYLLGEWISTLVKVIASNTQNLAYIFMINSMIQNAGAISIGYPLFVFGYALFEERGPGKRFWYFIIYYTLAILIIKYTIQLTVFEALSDTLN